MEIFLEAKAKFYLVANLYSRRYARPSERFFSAPTESKAHFSQDIKTLFFRRGIEERAWMNFGLPLKYLKTGINMDLLSGREILHVGEK